MRRLIAAVLLLVIVLVSYLISFFYIKNTCDNANRILDECINLYEQDLNASKKAEELNKYWSGHEKYLSVFANHSMIDDIELAISSLLIYANTDDNVIFYEYSGTVATLLHQMMEDTRPSMHSIL